MLNKQSIYSLRTEIIAGATSFMTVAYVVAVNAAVLSLVGMPFDAVVIATVLTSMFGCLLMALWANSPLIVVPGMGDNAFFVYTLVLAWGFTWQQSLTITFFAGMLFALVAFLGGANYLLKQVPTNLVRAMSAGIGLFLCFVGLKNGGLIIHDEDTFVALGDLTSPTVITTLLTLLVLLPLYLRNIKGSFLISIIVGTLIGIILGIVDVRNIQGFSLNLGEYSQVLAAYDFSILTDFDFWIALFSLSMMLIFQNMGAQLGILPEKEKFPRSFQAFSLSVIGASFFGSSATVSAAESSTGIAAGGRTGITPFVAGLLFLPTLFIVPLLKLIPMSAIAPIFIIVGALLLQNLRDIPLHDLSEGFPAYLMLAVMPLTFSITNGIAFGFIAYPIVKIVTGRKHEVTPLVYMVAVLFLFYFIVSAM